MAKNSNSIGEIRKKVTKTHEFIFTSYHEAAHTIYALLHYMYVCSVFVKENKKLKRIIGTTYYEDFYDAFDSVKDPTLLNKLILAEISINYAGVIAERHLFKSITGSEQVPKYITAGSFEDNISTSKLISQYNLVESGKKRYAYKQKICRSVHTTLQNNWDAVSLVAHELFKRHKLEYVDLKILLTTKTVNTKFWKEQFKKIDYIHNNNQAIDEQYLMDILFV